MANDKVPWPGDWAIVRAGAYVAGLTGDKSGVDALDAWAETATPEELDYIFGPLKPDGTRDDEKSYCYALGMIHGLATYPLWKAFWNWLFGVFGL